MDTSKFVLFLVFAALGGFAYLVITWTNTEIANIKAGAASTASHEVEDGVITEATTVYDDSASHGKYVQF